MPALEPSSRPAAAYLLFLLLLVQGVSGLAGGLALTLDPTGDAIGLPRVWLEGSPFPDYRVPGLFLLAVLGAAPLWVAARVWQRKAWAWPGALMVGLVLLAWLLVEIRVVGFQNDPPLQVIYGLVGAGIVILCLAPSVREDLAGTR
jgi:hypothetical protein